MDLQLLPGNLKEKYYLGDQCTDNIAKLYYTNKGLRYWFMIRSTVTVTCDEATVP
jgi:hypothetical protein